MGSTIDNLLSGLIGSIIGAFMSGAVSYLTAKWQIKGIKGQVDIMKEQLDVMKEQLDDDHAERERALRIDLREYLDLVNDTYSNIADLTDGDRLSPAELSVAISDYGITAISKNFAVVEKGTVLVGQEVARDMGSLRQEAKQFLMDASEASRPERGASDDVMDALSAALTRIRRLCEELAHRIESKLG